ncbi:MAG: CocE/NonD family hydrolase [Acidobacteria bacterium]|nr:CocE/NonD family hydrolase [Acidobacteriota bacterium]
MKRSAAGLLALLVLAGWAGCAGTPAARPRTTPGEAAAPADARPTTRAFRDIETWSEYVTMRDGVRLAVDVHLPKGLAVGERTATILHMSRYYRSLEIRALWKLFVGFGPYTWSEVDIREQLVKAGYSWVDVDVRGSGASFGRREYPLSPDEVLDGAELVDWIVRQWWSAGVVGATGISYDGTAAEMLLRNRHPAVKAIVPRFSGWDVYGNIFFPGGLQASGLLSDWSRLNAALDHDALNDVFGWRAGLLTSGVRPVDDDLLDAAIAAHADNVDVVDLFGPLVYRDDTDPRGSDVSMDDFSPHLLGDASDPDVAIYSYGGWFDGAHPRGQVRRYVSRGYRGDRLLLGPWFHGGDFNASPYATGGHDFDHAGEVLRFFDYHLRGIDDGFTSDDPVRYYTMGAEVWNRSRTWPPPGVSWQSYFLAPDGGLGGNRSGLESASDRYKVDETVSTGPGSRWGVVVVSGAKRGYPDRRDSDRRLLTYTSPPLEYDLEVTGHPIARLFMSANATDGALFVYLEDVHPDGRVSYVTEGQLRLIHRQTTDSPIAGDPVPFRTYLRADARALTPGEVVEVTVDLLPTSFVFRAGHAIRVAIAGADAGNFDAPVPTSPLIFDLHRDAPHPSRIELPTYPEPVGAGRVNPAR